MRRVPFWAVGCGVALLGMMAPLCAATQQPAAGQDSAAPYALRARRFLAGRTTAAGASAAAALNLARQQHQAMVEAQEQGTGSREQEARRQGRPERGSRG